MVGAPPHKDLYAAEPRFVAAIGRCLGLHQPHLAPPPLPSEAVRQPIKGGSALGSDEIREFFGREVSLVLRVPIDRVPRQAALRIDRLSQALAALAVDYSRRAVKVRSGGCGPTWGSL